MTARLIPTIDGWWCVTGPRVARLPHEAVADGALTHEADTALKERGFFAAPAKPFAVTVLTATSCNLGCAYCFQNIEQSSTNPFAPTRIPTAMITRDTIARTRDFIEGRMTELQFDTVSLMLFGGEPLLNPQGCLGMLRALQPLGLVHGEMISNTVLLRPKLAGQLSEAGLKRIQVTFDGGRENHDRTRVDRRGGATYDTIIANITKAATVTDLDWHFRVNVSHRNLDGLEALIDDLGTLPLPKPATLHLALIDDVGIGYDNTVAYTDELTQRFLGLIGAALDHGLTVPVRESVKNCRYCGEFAGGTGAVINADGTLGRSRSGCLRWRCRPVVARVVGCRAATAVPAGGRPESKAVTPCSAGRLW